MGFRRQFTNDSWGLVILTTISTMGMVSLWFYSQRNKKQKKEEIDNSYDNSSALQQRQFLQASQLAKGLTNIANADRLMLYGLYKQATEGDRTGKSPSSYQIVAHAKYSAWGKFKGMDKQTAKIKYCEVIQHFSTGGKSIFAPDDDNADIVYSEDDDDSCDSDDKDDDQKQKNPTISGFGVRQSTMSEPNLLTTNTFEESSKYEKEFILHDYARKGNLILLQRAIDNGEDVSKKDESGQTALHFAADQGHTECVSSLIRAGADVNASDVDGISVLQSSVIGGHKQIAQLLLEAGANPDQKDDDGDSARSFIDSDDNEMIQLFQKY